MLLLGQLQLEFVILLGYPLELLGSQVGEDQQNIIDAVKKIFEVIQVIRNDRIELASYQLTDLAHILYT